MDNNVSKFNVANVFTFARLPLCFVGIWIYDRYPVWGVAVIALAALTDFLDGQVARRFNCVTEFGRRLDPATDKVFMVIVLIFALVKASALGGTVVLWAIVTVELLIAATSVRIWRITGHEPVVVKVGKFGMFGRMVAVTVLLLSTTVSDMLQTTMLLTGLIAGSIGVALGVLAWIDYLVQAKVSPALL